MKKFLKQNKFSLVAILVLVFLGVYCSKGLFTYYAFFTHDGDHHIARSFDAIVALREGHFPLRWTGSLNHYCGIPIYNFFYPLIYYLVFLINFLVNDVILSLKFIYFFTLLLTPVFFYLWLSRETKYHLASFVGAVLYLFVPYRFLLIFVRGSPEFMSYLILPLLLFLISGLFEDKLKGKSLYLKGFLTVIVGSLLVISHNFAAMFLLPIIAFFILYKLILLKFFDKTKIAFILLVFLSFFGLAAFFIGPAWMEQSQTKLATLQTINYQDHFPTLRQLIRSPWGYYYSSPGTKHDQMSFMLGYAQWLVLFFSALFLVWGWLRSKKRQQWFIENSLILSWFFLSLFLIFLILPYSLFLWERVIFLQKIQFSWRLLGVTSFTIAALAGFLLSKIKEKKVLLGLAFIFIFFALVGNRNHLLSQPTNDITAYYQFENRHIHRFSTTTFEDDVLYRESEKGCTFEEPFILIGPIEKADAFVARIKPSPEEYQPPPFTQQRGTIKTLKEGVEIPYQVERGNTFGKITLESPVELETDIRLNLEYFPGAYQLFFNQNLVQNDFNCQGRICLRNVKLNVGNNSIEWQIIQTPTQKFFNGLSLFFLLLWLVLLFGKTKLNLPKLKKFSFLIPLLFVFLIFSFFRFYHLNERVIFDWDQERDAFIIKQILTENKLTLIGPRVLGPEGFFLGPYFTYLLTPFYFITTLHPQAIVLFIVLYNLTFFALAYWLLQKLFNRQTALIFLLIWSLHLSLIEIDQIAWNPILVPLMVVFSWFFLAKYFKKPSLFFSLIIGLIIGMGINFHFQLIYLIPFSLVFLINKKLNFKRIMTFLIGIGLTFLPLFLFDLRHQFLNTRLLINFLTPKNGGADLFAWLPVWQNISSGFGGFNLPFFPILFYLLPLGMIIFLWRQEAEEFKKKFYLAATILWLIFPFGFTIFGQRPSEYYFNFLYPFLVLFLTLFLIKVMRKWQLVFLLLLFLLLFKGSQLVSRLGPKQLGLSYKEKVVLRIGEIAKKEKFNVSYSVPPGMDAGYHYLFDFYQVNPSQNSDDPLFQIVIPPQEVDETYGRIGLKIPPGFKP